MNFRSRLSLLSIAVLVLGACAPAPMKGDERERMVSAQRQALPAAIKGWHADVSTRALGKQYQDIEFGSSHSSVAEVSGDALPYEVLRLPQAHLPYDIDFLSFSDSRHSAMRFDNRLFIRPSMVLLDQQLHEVARVDDAKACWARLSDAGALWTRFHVASDKAAYAIFYPSLSPPTQLIDTRAMGFENLAAPAVQTIADARQSYIATLSLGVSGLVAIRIAEDEKPLGRCVGP